MGFGSFLTDIGSSIFGDTDTGFASGLSDILFGGKDANGAPTSGVLSPKGIIEGLGIYSTIKGQKDKEKAAADAAASKGNSATDLENLQFEHAKELLALKAAQGGGGAGTDMRPYVFDAYKNRGATALASSTLTIQALKNLMEAAQRPLSK